MSPDFCYFDNNATTQVDPEVVDAMLPFLREQYGNPSSIYGLGKAARKAVDHAREQVAELIGASEEEILFTSSGTESNNTALLSAIQLDPDRKHFVTSTIEHSAVLKPAEHLARRGYAVSHVSPSREGLLDADAVAQELTEETALVSMMWANNETGVLSPISKIADKVAEQGLFFHTDAVQAVGKIPISVHDLPIHFLSLSGHKIYCPKGIGALYISSRTRFVPLLRGGAQERERRGGTESVALIVAFGKACEIARKRLESDMLHIRQMRDAFEALALQIPGAQLNGHPTERLATTSNLSFDCVDSEPLLMLLDQAGIACSAGSACTTGSLHPSHVLMGMHLGAERARSALRFSFGRFNRLDQIEPAVQTLRKTIEKIRSLHPRTAPLGASPALAAVPPRAE